MDSKTSGRPAKAERNHQMFVDKYLKKPPLSWKEMTVKYGMAYSTMQKIVQRERERHES